MQNLFLSFWRYMKLKKIIHNFESTAIKSVIVFTLYYTNSNEDTKRDSCWFAPEEFTLWSVFKIEQHGRQNTSKPSSQISYINILQIKVTAINAIANSENFQIQKLAQDASTLSFNWIQDHYGIVGNELVECKVRAAMKNSRVILF